MGTFLNRRRAECREFQLQLEDAAGATPSAKGLSELLAAAPADLKAHAAKSAQTGIAYDFYDLIARALALKTTRKQLVATIGTIGDRKSVV